MSARSPRSASAPASPAVGRRGCPTPSRLPRGRSRASPKIGRAGRARASSRSAWHGAASAARARASPRCVSRNSTTLTVHVASSRKAVNQIESLYKAKLMGKDVQLIHTLSASPAELDMIKESGAAVSVSPGSELRIGYGYPQTSEMLAKGIPLGISVDTSALVGSSNLFAVLKLARDCENAKAESEFKMPAHKALELGTIEGARSM